MRLRLQTGGRHAGPPSHFSIFLKWLQAAKSVHIVKASSLMRREVTAFFHCSKFQAKNNGRIGLIFTEIPIFATQTSQLEKIMKKLFVCILSSLLIMGACTTKDRKAEMPEEGADSIAAQAAESPAQAVETRKPGNSAKPNENDRAEAEPQEAAAPIGRQDSAGSAAPESVSSAAASGELNGHAWVDLGLSVKWATHNVGAERPEDSGNYFAWGERKAKESYTKDNSRTDGTNIDNIVAHRRRDVARAEWGEGWRMPTKAEVMELAEKCEVTWLTQNGVNGCLVKSKANGASIFLPAAGYRGAELYESGESGRYWTGISETGDPDAEFLFFYSDHFNWHRDHRYYGLTVRPVTK